MLSIFLSAVVSAIFLCLALAQTIVENANERVKLLLNEKSGYYKILLDNKIWLESSDDIYVSLSGKRLSLREGTLVYHSCGKNDILSSGQDALGSYEKYSLCYGTSSDSILLRGNIRVYPHTVVFEQVFPTALENTSVGNADLLSTSFPSFQIKEEHVGDAFAQWVSWYYVNLDEEAQKVKDANSHHVQRKTLVAPGFNSPQFGKWNEDTIMLGGIGGSGVVAVYDSQGKNTMVMSAMTNAMTVSHITDNNGVLSYGIMGNVTTIPQNYHIEIIVQFPTNPSQGLTETVYEWGNSMRAVYNKPSTASARERDITLQYLGYTTDNGAYYYYHTEPNKNYEDTLLDLAEYAKNPLNHEKNQIKSISQSQSIPYKYILLDSWWYYKGSNGGVSNWSPQPDLFPNGLEYLYEKTKWFVQAHNRYWSLDNVYSKSFNGPYTFVEDYVKNGSMPYDDRFWSDLLSLPSKSWGLKVYEQDWLFNEFYQYVSAMLEDVEKAQYWLTSMASGAKKNDLTIQYCMPYMRHVLTSVQFDVVTQARASDDYVVAPYEGNPNWRIAGQSLIFDALGLASSKDGYWSTSFQPNNPYGEERYEPCPRLQAAVTALSAGPVAIADGIGYSDVDLIMKSVRLDGRLLQPSAPATLIDAVFVESALQNGIGPRGDVWFAPSLIGHSHDSSLPFGSIFVANLADSWEIRPSHLHGSAKKFDYFVSESNTTMNVQKFSESRPLTLKVSFVL